MITKQHIKEGIEKGILRLKSCPYSDGGVVCAIGGYWFYVGKAINVIDSIFQILEDFRSVEDFSDEYAYCLAILYQGGIIK